LARAGLRIVGEADDRDLALAGIDRHAGERDHADVGRAALVPYAADLRLQPHRFGERLAVHRGVLRGRHLDEQRIDRGLLDAGVGERVAAGLDVHRHRAAPGQAPELGVSDAGDDVFAAHQITPSFASRATSS
jgi:hypothetical protein